MESQIERYSYWLGVVCVVIAVVLRAADAMGMGAFATRGANIGYMSFLKGALLFLLVAIATANHRWAGKNP
jgi:uncharacterized membrane protein YhaH (DUF805 family)